MIDRKSKTTIVLRVGTLLIAIALAFGLVSYMSSLTVSGYHDDTCYRGSIPSGYFGYYCSNVEAPAGTFTVLDSWNPTSQQQMYFFNMSSSPVDAEVYLLNTNQTSFNIWVAHKSGLPLGNFSSYIPENLVWFSDYVASHGNEVAGRYDVSKTNTVVRYFAPSNEPLMEVVTDGNAQLPLNFSNADQSVGVRIVPSLGFQVTGYLAASGAVLTALGLMFKRRQAAVA